jgi:hypothetical protein
MFVNGDPLSIPKLSSESRDYRKVAGIVALGTMGSV